MPEAVLCGLIGAGIQRSLAPALHEEEARHHGLRLHYQLIDLASHGAGVEVLPALLQAARIIGFRGLNITFPCKQSVIPLLDTLSEEARTIGAVNTVVREGGRLVGHNTDASGWSWGFRRALPRADLSRVLLLGAGGAGSAVRACGAGPGRAGALVVDREDSRARRARDQLGHACEGAQDLAKALARRERPDPRHADRHGELSGLPSTRSCCGRRCGYPEMVYVPLETALLKAAARTATLLTKLKPFSWLHDYRFLVGLCRLALEKIIMMQGTRRRRWRSGPRPVRLTVA